MNGVPQREVHPVLDGLTPAQTAAATQPGSALVLSGAGSGKTRTLTAAVAYRIDVRGIAASRVIAVTFTNRAAAEMAGRIRTALGGGRPPTWRNCGPIARRPPTADPPRCSGQCAT